MKIAKHMNTTNTHALNHTQTHKQQKTKTTKQITHTYNGISDAQTLEGAKQQQQHNHK